MLKREEISRAVDMQQRSYRLLRWMAGAVKEGFISFETAHHYSTLPEAANGWIKYHYLNIPPSARVAPNELDAFCAFFTTYLENSFDLIQDPGKHLYSPDAHCFCPMCSWLIDAPNLKAKKVSLPDKRRARKMKISVIRRLATEHGVELADEQIDALIDSPELGEAISLATYAYDLLGRVRGIATGPAVLVLWRGFAWTREGSPKKKFKLSTEMILESEKRLCESIL